MAHVDVHSSVFPENIQRDLLQSLRIRRIDPKFHYLTYKQSQKWLALHEAWSPSRTDADCAAVYDRAYLEAAGSIGEKPVHLIGLGCGGGQKDVRLLNFLTGQGTNIFYTPSDISLGLVLTALQSAQANFAELECHPLLADLTGATNLLEVLERHENGRKRLITFFGIIPNFEPDAVIPRLVALVRPGDLLLFSANLAPGADYAAGVKHVLPGYDNPQTRDWLLTFLLDLGVEMGDGAIQFSVEDSKSALKRIIADYSFSKARVLTVHGERFEFRPLDTIRLFFSYRYTPDRIASVLARYKLTIQNQWIARSGEEGVFLCGRAGS